MIPPLTEKGIEQEQEQEHQKPKNIPTIYRVTTGSLSEYTKATYQYDINEFLAFYKITDIQGIELLKEYSPKLIRQMVMDFVIHLRDVRKVSRSSIKVHCAALSRFFYTIRDDDTRLNWHNSIKTLEAAVIHFFDMNDVILNKVLFKKLRLTFSTSWQTVLEPLIGIT